MTRGSPNQLRAICLALCALSWICVRGTATAQANPPVTTSDQVTIAQLLGKAHALEVRGRIDLAKQMWQQTLLVDPNNTEALAGMARAAKLEGKNQEANQYLNKLRAINPNDPNIERVQNMGTAQDMSAQLQEAGRLSQAGQYARAMSILRQVYGTSPPPGDAALSYYQTEAATEDGRPDAIAGLRALMDKYPQDSRYQITLGKILTYNPRTREEGRRLLQRHPNDPDAAEALRQSLVWDAQNPATTADIRAYLAKHKDQQLSTALAQTEATERRNGGRPAAAPLTPEQLAAQAALRERNAESQAAYSALNAHRYAEAEERFQAILAKDPQSAQALAGMGYVRMSQSNFGGAISYLEQAVQDGSRDAGVEKALRDSRFYYTMQVATAALNENDLATAETQFTNASHLRPNDPSPLLGLGGTLMKAQQPAAAVSVFSQYVRMSPSDKAAWRGLFMAQYGAGQYAAALDTDRRIPERIKRELIRDPEYLKTLASTYEALGRDADAQRVLRSALDLPFPADARGVRADMQLEYASLLSAAGHQEQAAGLYRQVLEGDSTNIGAYEGLVNIDHLLGHDAEAYQVLQSMPPQTYEMAMQESGFQTTVAAIYQSQGHYDLAQQTLETFLENEQASGQKPSVPAEVQLAGIYLQHGDTVHAYPLYRAALQSDPARTDAWNGLLTSLHSTGHDQEALAEIQQIPPNIRLKLETDPAYLQTVGSIYAGLNQPQAAMSFYNRVQQRYVSEHVVPPADIDIQEAWLLFNSHNDVQLFRQLMMLGGRQDLTDQQRLTVQTIWANWAVRRANQNIDEGNYKRAIAILNAAAKAFPGNPDVLKALASGYASAGLPKQAVEIFKAQDLSTGTVADYRSSVGAALADNDLKDAETWLRFGLDQYPRDAQLLVLAAKFETARGDPGRAADYYKASLTVMPPDDPGLQLSDEMSHPLVRRVVRAPAQSQDLASLLSQADPNVNRGGGGLDLPVAEKPYLPSYNGSGVTAPVQIYSPATGMYPNNGTAPQSGYPVYNTQPQNNVQPQERNSTLKDYVPQSQLELPVPVDEARMVSPKSVIYIHPSPAMEAKYGPYVSYDPSQGLPHRAAKARNAGDRKLAAFERMDDGVTAKLSVASYKPPQQGTYAQPGYTQPAYQAPAQPAYQPPAYSPPAYQQPTYQPRANYPPPTGTTLPPATAEPIHLQSGQQGNDQNSQTPYPAAGYSQQPAQPHPIHLNYPQPPRPAQSSLPPTAPTQTPAYPQMPSYAAPSNAVQPQGYAPGPGYTPPAQVAPYGQVPAYRPPSSYAPPTQTEPYAPAQNYQPAPSYVPPARTIRPSGYAPAPSGAAPQSGVEPQSFPVPQNGVEPQSYPVPSGRSSRGNTQEGYTPDGTPIVSYLQNSRPAAHRRVVPRESSAALRARAEAIRRNQAQSPEAMMGQSHPPAETYDTAPDPNAEIQDTQFSSQPYSPAGMQGAQVPQSPAPVQGTTTTVAPQPSSGTYQNANPNQPGESYGQQYPQPNTRTTTTGPVQRRRRARSVPQTTTTTPAPAPQAPIGYPNYAPPLTNPGYPQIGQPYPLATPPSDYDLQEKSVPPLRGYYDPRVDDQTPLTERQQAELDLATIEGSYSGWLGGSVIGSYRSGTPGIDRMAGVEVPFEASAGLGKTWRITALPTAIFLNSGVLNTTTTNLGTTPIFGTVIGTTSGSTGTVYPQQFAAGFGGEVQLTSSTFAIAGGYSAYGFLVRNVIGRARWKPGNGHFTLFGGRDPVKETQLSYAGEHDTGRATIFSQGPVWGGVVQTGGGIRFDAGNERAGLYIQGEGADLTGYHVLENRKYDGTMGAYFRVKVWPQYGSLNIGGTVFGEHYDYNERIESYGNGGYFSPNVYFLFAVPVTFNGHYKENLHYTINGSVGVQTFQENEEEYYPLDAQTLEGPYESSCASASPSNPQSCGYSPLNSNTGLNYSIDAKMAYRVTDHWYIGGFLTGNNTNNYNTISGGFFARYLIRPQTQTVEYPTGLFPVEGFRPLRVP